MSMILESLRAAGLAYAVDQIVDLVTQDVAGVHSYTMNSDVKLTRLLSNKRYLIINRILEVN